MKKLVLLGLLSVLCGCAYNQVTITADHSSTVNCTGTVDKPVSVDTFRNPVLQGNVPVQGGTVTDPQLITK